MDGELTQRVRRFAPPWLRYMLTLAEAVRTGETWVVASGDDIALWDTADSGSVLPFWPTHESAVEAASEDAEAVAVALGELAERLLPFLVDADANVALFPNFEDDALVEPATVADDLADLIAEPVDVAAQLTAVPSVAAYEERALLEGAALAEAGLLPPESDAAGRPAPATTGDRYADTLAAASATGVLWLLADAAANTVVGVVFAERPALALFASREQAVAFAEAADTDPDAPVTPRAVDVGALANGGLLLAYGARWGVALTPGAHDAVFTEPARLALDLAEACGERR